MIELVDPQMSEDVKKSAWVPLSPRERRVLGVLIEKQKTTPEYYPLSVAALLTGCNQKSNRDPVTSYDIDDVEDALHALRQKGLAILVEGSGRVVRWKHQAYDGFGLRGKPAEMAVLAELLLRGPQTEGELRQRASRMDEIPDLPALQGLLATLGELSLVLNLSPPGQKRGVVIAHCLYPPEELERLKAAHAAGRPESQEATGEAAVSGGRPLRADELSQLRAELQELRGYVQRLDEELRRLRAGLGEPS
jgi:uncharacterized protein YceH (UPF0502 family)